MKKIKVKVTGLIKISKGVQVIEYSRIAKDRENQYASLGLEPPIVVGVYVHRVEPPYEHGYYDIAVNRNSISIPAQDFHEDRINVIIELELVKDEGEYLIVKAILESEGLHQAQIKIRRDSVVK